MERQTETETTRVVETGTGETVCEPALETAGFDWEPGWELIRHPRSTNVKGRRRSEGGDINIVETLVS